jgi:hypothetical protein
MKIRNGFVSNSSSSSFVVVLPKEPYCPSELKEMLFGDEKGAISIYHYNPIKFIDIASRVFKDISSAKDNKKNIWPKIANLSSLIDIFKYMPYYNINGPSLEYAKDLDEHGGRWENLGEFLTPDDENLKKLRDWAIKLKKSWDDYLNSKAEIINKAFPSHNHNDFSQKVEKFRKTDKKYLALEKNQKNITDKLYKEEDKLRIIIAKQQAKAFLNKHKGKFIFITSYSDNLGEEESTLEHGDIFYNIPHIKISNH